MEALESSWIVLVQAPFWAQVGIGWFALMAIFMVFGPVVNKIRYRRQFDALVRAMGLEPTKDSDWPFTVKLTVEGRPFELRYDYGTGRQYRGPLGYVLVTSTALADPKWAKHQVQFERDGSPVALMEDGKRSTGDASFDARFTVVSQGEPVRDGWLDATLRAAVSDFLNHAPREGLIWVREGEVRYTMGRPWKGIDAPSMQALLKRHATLATALERTARGLL